MFLLSNVIPIMNFLKRNLHTLIIKPVRRFFRRTIVTNQKHNNSMNISQLSFTGFAGSGRHTTEKDHSLTEIYSRSARYFYDGEHTSFLQDGNARPKNNCLVLE